MTPEVLSRAIDPFFTTKEVGKGTGLGLSMIFGIVQGHHGCLTIKSKPGLGTQVAIYLPRLVDVPQPDVERQGFAGSQVLEPEVMPGKNILVIDDEQAVLDVVRRFLEIAGHKVQCATSSHQGLEILARLAPADLVILDLMMPGESSIATYQRIRQRRPNLPVLVCTGMPEGEQVPELLEAGAAGILRKPFRMNELWYAVSQALMGRSP